MITRELVMDVFSRMNEWAEQPFIDNMISMNVIGETEEELLMVQTTISSIVHSQATMEILGMPVTDPFEAAAKAFLIGILCGRLEIQRMEEA